MREEISSLELFYIVKEFQEFIGGRIDKVYQKNREFLFTMYVSGKGKKLLKVMPNMTYLSDYKEEFPSVPPGFCKFLRKHLGNTIIRKITQKAFERIVEIIFEGKEKRLLMIIELFSNGNLVLCNEDYKVMSALESHKWKDRTVRGGIKYEYPPVQVDTLSLKEEEFADIIKKSDKDSIVKTLAVDFGLGGTYAEELCLLSKVEKTKKKITRKEVKQLYKCLRALLSKNIKANIVGKEILPFKLKLFEKEEKKFFNSFNEAIDSKFSEKITADQKKVVEDKKSEELEKARLIIKQQEEMIEGLERSSEENKRKGEFIYENYEQIKNILTEIIKAKEKFSWKDIKEKLKGHKVIKQVNEKEGKITVELK
ncbi:MAG: NFACT family protein [DPANN group archaeon]|nr:NFACT family protein [DPANN group archaeon]